ncbi:hypothetical protein INT45_002815 [Circinella minor]|uniref:Uncharacterized protein n=1 Tax=Circinella minor TaxID=1195481 RepID=A0A8H7VKV8_9FUNG|nr:hypothetical protein INT45_002815 [Circinella minor]
MAHNHNILWLQTTPSIAAIYYHTYLSKTHVLYCPDAIDDLDTLRVRELGHQIIRQMEADDKQLAVHFMQPCPIRKHQDLVRFIHSKRGSLNMKCLVLPTTPIQTKLLSGWAMGLDPDYEERNIWLKRCLTHFHLDAFNNNLQENNGVMMKVDRVTEYMEPFCIADQTFGKRALIINVTRSLCVDKNTVGFILNGAVEAAIHGWADVTKQLSLQGTVILIADENKLYKGIPGEQGQLQNIQLQRHRDRTNQYLEQLGSDCPIYLYTRDYAIREPESIIDKIACIQHLHGLSISGSFMLSWCRRDSGLDQHNLPLKYFSKIRQFYLQEILVQKSRVIWKADLYLTTNTTVPDNTQVFQSWKTQMESLAEERINIKKSSQERQLSIPFDNDDEEKDMYSLPLQLEDREISDLRNSFADRIHHDIVREYINNKGAFLRGEDILNTLDQMNIAGDKDSIDIWAKAYGSSKDAYTVVVTIVSKSKKEELRKYGKCKHCTALLLRFMVNADEFEYISSRSQRPSPPSTTIDNKAQKLNISEKSTNNFDNQNTLATVTHSRQGNSHVSPPPKSSIESQAFVPNNEESITNNVSFDIVGTNRSFNDVSTESVQGKTLPESISNTTLKPLSGPRCLPWNKPAAAEKEPKAIKRRGKKKDTDTIVSAATVPVTSKKRKTQQRSTNDTGLDEESLVSETELPKKTRSKKAKTTTTTRKPRKTKEEEVIEEKEDSMLIDPKMLTARKRNSRGTTKPKTYNESDNENSSDDSNIPISTTKSNKQRTAKSFQTEDFYFESFTEHNNDNDGDNDLICIGSVEQKLSTRRKPTYERGQSKSPIKSFSSSYDNHEDYTMEKGLDHLVLDNENSENVITTTRSAGQVSIRDSDSDNHPLPSNNYFLSNNQRVLNSNDNDDGNDSDATDDGLGVIYRKDHEEDEDDKGKESTKSMSLDYTMELPHSMNCSVDDKMTTTEDEGQKSQIFGSTLAMTTDDLFDELGL